MAGTPSVTQGSNTTVTDKDDTVVYTFTFVNTGTVDLVNLAVQDPLFGSGNVCTIASLPAGNTDNTSCVLTYTITQADVDAGSILNTAASTAYAPDGATLILENDTANDNSVSTPITQAPSLSVIKSAATLTTDADSSTDITLGDTLTYTVTATNDGNTTLSNVVVSDPNLDPSSFTCLTVAPNASCMLSGTHMVDLNESNAGNVVNTASVVADEITSSVPSNTVTTPVVQTLEFTMTKTSDTADIGVPGIITYTFTFTNTGNVSLTELTIEDTNIDTGTLNNCPVSSLAPGETATVVTNSASSWSDATDVVVNDLPTNLIITNVSSANCSALPCTIPLLNIGDSETITVEATAPLVLCFKYHELE
ncbi:hypothetical protein GQR58_006877 [Nymphon striatum]|nr:hypothetical protein GQR58_006877 [Nymphon striatum]